MTKILSVILLLNLSAFACDISIDLSLAQNVNSSYYSELLIESENALKKKGYFPKEQSLKLAKFFISKNAYESFKKTKSSVKLMQEGQLLNYTQGFGKAYKKESRAYKLKQFKRAVRLSVSHLPRCR